MTSPARVSAPAAALLVLALPRGCPRRPAPASACASLAQQQLPNTTITAAQAVTTGSFTPPGSTNAIANLPPFCRVAGVIAPTSESQILFEVWLPIDNWNGKFAGVGNGGWAGTISFGPLAEQLRRGYATASTNTGHEAAGGANMARFAFEKPEQLIDFAYRSHHETSVVAKALTEAFYSKPPERSYFIGCSSGGYEGLMEAQRFPADYDGIVAGMPANNWTRLMAGDFDATLAVLQGRREQPSGVRRSACCIAAALAACDRKDGVVDGVLEDPRQCAFDPAALSCKAGQAADTCLTPAQVEAARRVYGGLKDPQTGAQLYPGLAPGSEPFWPNRDPANPFPIPIAHYKWLVFADPTWDWKSFDFSDPAGLSGAPEGRGEVRADSQRDRSQPRRIPAARRQAAAVPRLERSAHHAAQQHQLLRERPVVLRRGGRDRAGTLQDVQGFYRLFMAPGMAHCGGGPGPNTFDMQAALEQWVERGVAPDQILATRSVNGVVDRLRPLCAYPKIAAYKGTGDTNDAANFECRDPGAPGR